MMLIKIAKSILRLIIVLLIFECLVGAFLNTFARDSNQLSIDSKSFASYLFTALLSETEEEKCEEGHKAVSIELGDFSKVTSFLSNLHTPHQRLVVYGHRDDHHLSWFKLFRVFRI